MDDCHRSDDVRVGIVDGGRSVRRPARVGNADGAAEWLTAQLAREIVELPFRPPADELALIDRADARAIVAAIFEPLEPVEQALRDFAFANDSNDSAHRWFPN